MATKSHVHYENNPFVIGIEGLKLLFTQARSVGIYTIVVTVSLLVLAMAAYVIAAIVDVVTRSGPVSVDAAPSDDGGIIMAIALLIGTIVYMLVSLLLFGVAEHTAAMLAKGKPVTLKQSFNEVLKRYPSYVWMYILLTVKVFLWSLLLIVPGIIMLNRYVLSGTVFFAEGKRGNAAIKRSADITRNAWMTTYGASWLWSLISQGLAVLVFWPGSMAILYRQLVDKTDRNADKPPAHILSWLTFLVPLILLILYILFIFFVVLFIFTLSRGA